MFLLQVRVRGVGRAFKVFWVPHHQFPTFQYQWFFGGVFCFVFFLVPISVSLALLDCCLLIQRSNFNITGVQINGKSSYQIALWSSVFSFFFTSRLCHIHRVSMFLSSIFSFLLFSSYLSSLLPHPTTPYSLPEPLLFPTQSQFLNTTPTSYVTRASRVIIRQSVTTNNSIQPCILQSQNGRRSFISTLFLESN